MVVQDDLEDLLDAQLAEEAYRRWLEDPSRARPYAEVREEMVRDGLLDE